MHVGLKSEGYVGVAESGRDERDGYTVQMHEGGAGVARIMEAYLRHVEIADGSLPQRAQGRRVVRLAGLVGYDASMGTRPDRERKLLGGLAVSRRGEFGEQGVRDGQDATRVRGLGFVLVDRAATHVHSRRADPQRPVLEVDVSPALAGDLSTPQAGQSEMPYVSIPVIGNAA